MVGTAKALHDVRCEPNMLSGRTGGSSPSLPFIAVLWKNENAAEIIAQNMARMSHFSAARSSSMVR
jgi:hypothetical protein